MVRMEHSESERLRLLLQDLHKKGDFSLPSLKKIEADIALGIRYTAYKERDSSLH